MRLRLSALLLLAPAFGLVAVPAHAQQPGLVRIDPCTGKPYPPQAAPAPATAAARPNGTGASGSGTGTAGTAPVEGGHTASDTSTTSSGSGVEPPHTASSTTSSGWATATGTETPGAGTTATGGGPHAATADPDSARINRQALRLGRGRLSGQVRLGPAASVSVPTAFGVDAGELFLGVAYQGRTRYTREDDAAVVAGLGLGTRRVLALELALTSYSTVRGGPLETGGVSVKLHRALARNTSVAVGWENAVLWGDSDDDGSLYAVATRLVPLRRDLRSRLSVAVFTLGVGNGRFRFEQDDADGKETVNLFGAVGLRVTEPLSLVADWTGQDLNLAASVTPIPRVPVVLTAGVADVTGLAGDGARLIVSAGYGIAIRQPFQARP